MADLSKDAAEDGSQQIPPLLDDVRSNNDVCCKVGRISDAYNLSGVDNELKRQYEDGDATLHDLADYINNRVTATTLTAVGNPVSAEPATIRAALNDDESISGTERDNIRATLASRLNLDVLMKSFVSHETVRRHLNEHLEVSTSKGGFDTYEELKNRLTAYEDQYKDGVQSALRRANEQGLVNGGDFVVFSTRLECQHCSEVYRLTELIENGGCSCRE